MTVEVSVVDSVKDALELFGIPDYEVNTVVIERGNFTWDSFVTFFSDKTEFPNLIEITGKGWKISRNKSKWKINYDF